MRLAEAVVIPAGTMHTICRARKFTPHLTMALCRLTASARPRGIFSGSAAGGGVGQGARTVYHKCA